MKRRIRTEVDINYCGESVTIEEELKVGDFENRYVYPINHRNSIYILKSFKIRLEHLDQKIEL